MSTIYLAHDLETGERVALKSMSPEAARHYERFEREVRLLEQLSHPGIVRYIAHGRDPDGRPYLALEWLEGEDLETRLGRGPLEIGAALGLLERIAEALAVVHARGVVHRDLKPSNVFLVGGSLRDVRLLDFGVARLMGASVTRAGVLIGTPQYMSPEQAQGDGLVDARSDVFALGALLFECLAGRPPFVADSILGTLGRILFTDAPRLGELVPVPPELDALVARMLSRDPAPRPADGTELVRALRALPAFEAAELRLKPRLGSSERRLTCVLLTGSADRQTTLVDRSSPFAVAEAVRAETLIESATRSLPPPEPALVLANGSRATSLSEDGPALDLATKAARQALDLRKTLGPRVPIALATGRAIDGVTVAGDVIDRANELLAAPVVGVRLDDVTAGLLDVRFHVAADEHGFYLVGERDFDLGARTLLGRATPCVGRTRELGIVLGAYDDCVGEPAARSVLVTGAAGLGKTRLSHEAVLALRRRVPRPRIWRARGDIVASGSPFGMLAGLVRHAMGLVDSEPAQTARRRLWARVVSLFPEQEAERVATFIGELTGVAFSDHPSHALRAAHCDPKLLGDQVRRAFEDLVLAECARGPLVLLLDDLHWGDAPSVAAIDNALRLAAEAPLFVLALARPEVRDQFPRLWEERRIESLALGPLGKRAVEELASFVLGQASEPELVKSLVERSQGNAFFLEELLRGAATGESAVAPTVLALVEARLASLDADTRRLLRACSVFGDAFWPGAVRALLGDSLSLDTVQAIFGQLLEREIVTLSEPSRFAGERQYTFRHALLREGCRATLTEADLKLGHRLAAGWLESAGETDAVTLATHHDAGGDDERAARWWAKAAREALVGNDYRSALERSSRALDATDAAIAASAALTRMEALSFLGEFSESYRTAERFVATVPPGSQAWLLALPWLVTGAQRDGKPELAEPWADRFIAFIEPALQAVREERGAALHFQAVRLANLLLSMGLARHARRLVEIVERSVAPEALDPVAVAYLRGANARLDSDPWRTSRAAFDAMKAFEESGDLGRAAHMLDNLAAVLCQLGAWDELEPVIARGRTLSARLGLNDLLALLDARAAQRLLALGQLDEALELAGRAASRSRGRDRAESQLSSARIWLAKGRPERALADARAALESAGADLELEPLAFALIALAERALGHVDEAIEWARRAEVRLNVHGTGSHFPFVLSVLAEVLDGCGARAAARVAIGRARAELDRQAGCITSEAHRRTFLESVLDNARVLELCERLDESIV